MEFVIPFNFDLISFILGILLTVVVLLLIGRYLAIKDEDMTVRRL